MALTRRNLLQRIGAVGGAGPVAYAVGDDGLADVGGSLGQRHLLEQAPGLVGQPHLVALR